MLCDRKIPSRGGTASRLRDIPPFRATRRGGAGTSRGLRPVNTERAKARGHGDWF